jgi:8-oxo-dGTP pyrophosphatase MutT (NUDIX family)
MTTPRHSVSVAAAVIDDHGRVLVVQRRDNGRWEPPGGILEPDESIPAGLAREVREESGIEIRAERLTGVYKNLTLGVVALFFRARPIGGTPTTSDESTAVDWWTPDQIAAQMPPTTAVRVLDALRDDE